MPFWPGPGFFFFGLHDGRLCTRIMASLGFFIPGFFFWAGAGWILPDATSRLDVDIIYGKLLLHTFFSLAVHMTCVVAKSHVEQDGIFGFMSFLQRDGSGDTRDGSADPDGRRKRSAKR